uniref:Uncharacterized protein n=1 Tax=Cyprinodon variegatus TaxID=28743 RepID=A0A3Q2DWW4_CYPVA
SVQGIFSQRSLGLCNKWKMMTAWIQRGLLQFPFDKNHQIRSCRLPYNLIKCRKIHPELANILKTCPYNSRNLIPKHELDHHTETFEWDKEADSGPTPFVLGETSRLEGAINNLDNRLPEGACFFFFTPSIV